MVMLIIVWRFFYWGGLLERDVLRMEWVFIVNSVNLEENYEYDEGF